MKYIISIGTLVLLAAVAARSQRFLHPPVEPEAGRWHVQTTSGDQPAQVASGNPVTFDANFECNSGACGGKQIFTHDSTICDPIGFENISSGLDIDGSVAALQFAVSGGFGNSFIYTFVGNLETSVARSGAVVLSSATITGTYGSTPGGCNNGLPSDQGTFVANWYPSITGQYIGFLIPAKRGHKASFEIELRMVQMVDGTLTASAITGVEGTTGFEPVQNPCFSSTSLQATQGPGAEISGVSGNRFQVYALDTIGDSLTLTGTATQIGSNQTYQVNYEIVGGPCSGQSGTRVTFLAQPALLHHAPSDSAATALSPQRFGPYQSLRLR